MISTNSTEAADMAIAEFIYRCGLPPAIRTEYFKNMIRCVQRACKGYVSPGGEKLRTGVLDRTVDRCQTAVQPIYKQRNRTGCTLLSDKWTNVRLQAVVDFMLVSPDGALTHGARECSAVGKSIAWISEQMLQVNDSVGPRKVVQSRCSTQVSQDAEMMCTRFFPLYM